MLLYRDDLVEGDVEDAIASHARDQGFTLPSYGVELVRGVSARRDEIDAAIQEHLHDWTVSRLGVVERAVLRIAMFELITDLVPAPVAIDEAVELTRRYATPEAAKLVNGVLAGWLRAKESTVDGAADQSEEEEE